MRSHIFRKSCDTAPLNEYMEDSASNEILYWISVTLLKAAEPEKSPFRCLKKCPELQLRRPPHAAYFLRFDDPKKYKMSNLPPVQAGWRIQNDLMQIWIPLFILMRTRIQILLS